MKMTEEGLALIRRFEGFRAKAYRDPVGVWTIGYGHTSMAGQPLVRPGMVLTRAEAAAVLARDVEAFAEGVAALVKTPLADGQFSALVCFAFNVGLGNFKRSSVLAAVNAGRLDAVPRRLNLWVKAGGRVLPGLVTRRAAEGAMFARGMDAPKHAVTTRETPPAEARPAEATPVEAQQGKSAFESKTVWAALTTAVAASFQALGSVHPAWVVGLLLLLALIGAAIVVSERLRKAREDGV